MEIWTASDTEKPMLLQLYSHQVFTFVGVSEPQMRSFILGIKPEIELTKLDEKWQYKLITPHSTRTVTFTNGDVIDYVSITGQPVKVSSYSD